MAPWLRLATALTLARRRHEAGVVLVGVDLDDLRETDDGGDAVEPPWAGPADRQQAVGQAIVDPAGGAPTIPVADAGEHRPGRRLPPTG